MSATQPEPDPFSREGSGPGDGLGSEPNRFETWADGSTPLGKPAPDSSAAAGSPAGTPTQTPITQPTPYVQEPSSAGSASFPAYGSAHNDGYADPEPNDEAYAAYRGYQASAPNYASQSGQQGPGYPTYPSYPQVASYGYPYGTFSPPVPKSPYAVPALVLGIVGVFCAITGPVGLGLGIAAIKQIDAEPRRYSGRGLAIGGIVTGAIGTLWVLFYILSALA